MGFCLDTWRISGSNGTGMAKQSQRRLDTGAGRLPL